MQKLASPEEVQQYLEHQGSLQMKALIESRMRELIDEDTAMEDLLFFLILEPGDGLPSLGRALGLGLLHESGDQPWEVIEEHATCYELVFVLSSSGFGALVLASKEGTDEEILQLCRKYVHSPQPPQEPRPSSPTNQTAHRGGFFTPVIASDGAVYGDTQADRSVSHHSEGDRS